MGSLIASWGRWAGDGTVPIPHMSCLGHSCCPGDARAVCEQMGHPQHAAWGRGFMEGLLPRPGERGSQRVEETDPVRG